MNLSPEIQAIVDAVEERDLVTFQEHMRTVDRCCRCRACDNVRMSAYLRVLKKRNEEAEQETAQ